MNQAKAVEVVSKPAIRNISISPNTSLRDRPVKEQTIQYRFVLVEQLGGNSGLQDFKTSGDFIKRDFKIFKGLQKTSGDFKRLSKDFKGFQKTSRDFLDFKDFKRLQGTSGDFMRLHKTSKDFRRLHGTSEDFSRLQKTS